MLVVDVGNALYRVPVGADEAAEQRAGLILRTMGQLGTQAMVAGVRDLNAGAEKLKERAAKAKVKVLSVNLRGADGKLLFSPSLVTTVGGVKVGLIGASPAGEVGKELSGNPVVAAVLEEASRLRPLTDLVVVLAAVKYSDALQLANESKGRIDLILHSGESRGLGAAQRNEGTFVIPSGERGRQVGVLALDLSQKGPFVDLEEQNREAQLASMLASQVAELRKRRDAAADPGVKKQLDASLAEMDKSRKQHEGAGPKANRGHRTLQLSWKVLGPDLKDDPALKAEVERLEPPEKAP